MSSTSPELDQRLRFWAMQAGIFVALNLLDDPAWLALIFC